MITIEIIVENGAKALFRTQFSIQLKNGIFLLPRLSDSFIVDKSNNSMWRKG